MSEQDELLYEIARNLAYWHQVCKDDTRQDTLERWVIRAGEILAKVKQHCEQKKGEYFEDGRRILMDFHQGEVTGDEALEQILNLKPAHKQKRLDRPELRGKIENALKEIIDVELLFSPFVETDLKLKENVCSNLIRAITSKFLALFPDIEAAKKIWREEEKEILVCMAVGVIEDKIKEAKREEVERIVRDLEILHRPDYRVKDVIVYLKYRLGIKQALKEAK